MGIIELYCLYLGKRKGKQIKGFFFFVVEKNFFYEVVVSKSLPLFFFLKDNKQKMFFIYNIFCWLAKLGFGAAK